MRDNNKAKLIILLLVFSFGFTAPFYISSGAGAIAYITKEFGLDLVARTIARKLLTDLSNGVIESVNSLGAERPNNPKPAFVQNWKRFLASAQIIGENQFRAQLNYSIQRGVLCNDLKGPLALAFQAGNVPYIDIGDPNKNAELKQNTLTPFQTKMRCTIPDKTREEFKKDFEKGGGWDTWSRLLEPQNNLSGATLLSIEELQKQRTSQQEAKKSEVVAGQGFQGVSGACRGIGANAQCSFLGDTVTPAKILGEGASEFLDSNAKWFVSSDELSEVLLSIVGAAIKKLADFGPIGQAGEKVIQNAPDFLDDAEKDRENLENASKLPGGSACGENSECQSNYCTEGFCE